MEKALFFGIFDIKIIKRMYVETDNMSYRASTLYVSWRVHLLYNLQYRHFHRGHCRQPRPLPLDSTNRRRDRGWPTNESTSRQRPKRRSLQPRPIRDELWIRENIDRFWYDQILMDNENLVKIKLSKNVNFFAQK